MNNMNNVHKILNFVVPFLLGVFIANMVLVFAPFGGFLQGNVTGAGSDYESCLKYKQYLDLGVLSSRVSDQSAVGECPDKFPDLWYKAPSFDSCRKIKQHMSAGTLTDYLNNDFSQLDACNEYYGEDWTKPLSKKLSFKPENKICEEFKDVLPGNPMFDAVKFVNDNGIITGYKDCTFKPLAPINRAEAMKVILLGFDFDTSLSSDKDFSDVSSDAWFYAFVKAAHYFKIIDGYPDGTFRPGNTVIRSEMLKMFIAASELAEDISSVTVQPDICPDIQSDQSNLWFMPYFQVAKENGLLKQNENCAPGQEMSRGQVAELMFNYSKL